MAQWLRALALLLELPESIPSTHMAAKSCLLLQLQGTLHSSGLHGCEVHRYACRQHTHTGKKTERKPSTLRGGRGVCTDREQLFWRRRAHCRAGGEGSVGGNEVTRSQGHRQVFTDHRTSAKLVSSLAMRSLAVWLVWDSAVPQAVTSSLPKDS